MTDQLGGEVRMLIDGELVEAASGKRFENINPATEEVLGEVADASAEDMRRAIDSSRRRSTRLIGPTNHGADAAWSSCRPLWRPSGRRTATRSSPRSARRG